MTIRKPVMLRSPRRPEHLYLARSFAKRWMTFAALGMTLLTLPFIAAAAAEKVRVRTPIPQTRFFDFKPGVSLVFSHRRKKFLLGGWRETKQALKIIPLDVERGGDLAIRLLAELYAGSGELKDQFFPEFKLTPEEVLFKKDAWEVLAKLPLAPGNQIGDFRVKSLQASLETSTGTFRHCLRIEGLTESFTFAPYSGLIQWHRLDDEWTLKEILGSSRPAGENLEKRDLLQIEELAKGFCARYSVAFERLLTAQVSREDPGAAACRFLISRPDPDLPAGKRYEIEERMYLRENFGGKIFWGER